MRLSSSVLLLGLGSCGWVHTARGQATSEDVLVDLQPCVIAGATIEKDVSGVSEAYLFQEFFKGFWSSSQYYLIAPSGTLDLTVDDNHGRCNVVLVGTPMADDQLAQLREYSQTFQTRIVYFDEALMANDADLMGRLGLTQYFAEPLLDIPYIRLTDDASARIVNPSLQTDPLENNIFTRPVIQLTTPTEGTLTVVAQYADEDGNALAATDSFGEYPSVAACTYHGADGEEEMYIFFALAWFDLGSWGWAHYIAEWGTKGIFAGERRFYLGAMVDDLFLSTNVFHFNGGESAVIPYDAVADSDNEGEKVRMTSEDLYTLLAVEDNLNALYASDIITEFPLNAYGILDKVDSPYQFSFDDADAAELAKGELPQQNEDGTVGMDPIIDTNWWTEATIAALQDDFDNGLWDTDDLLMACIELKEEFYWQSHTMTHLARDNLGKSDCDTEDGGNSQIAVITGLYDSSKYAWRSMTTPGITGLFNKNCLSSAWENLITCAPGDNTYDGVQTDVSLVSSVSQFHSIYTSEEEVGFGGFQIVPRFATYVYYNCVSTDCLILENLYIRRVTCQCDNVDPGTIDNLNTDTTGCDMTSACPYGLLALETVDNVFDTEALATTRWLLNGRRDKYMFHQANVIPTTVPTGTKSLLEYWYEVVLEGLAEYVNMEGTSPFPVRSVKFDDLCTDFQHHEALDSAEALVTMTLTPDGSITGMELSAVGTAGVIPITIPASMVGSVSTTGLPSGQPYAAEEYGSDLTLYVATSSSDEPEAATKPSVSDLPAPPSGTTPSRTPSPTVADTAEPTPVPTVAEAAEPTPVPTAADATEPTPVPTVAEAAEPTPVPTAAQAAEPTPVPTAAEAAEPTPVPTAAEAAEPTPVPTAAEAAEPTPVPTAAEAAEPTPVPTAPPMTILEEVQPTPHPTPASQCTNPTASDEDCPEGYEKECCSWSWWNGCTEYECVRSRRRSRGNRNRGTRRGK